MGSIMAGSDVEERDGRTRHYISTFREMFDVFSPHFRTPLPDPALDTYNYCCKHDVHMTVSDLLHLVKRARARYLSHDIQVLLSDTTAKTDYQRACQLLNVGSALSDTSQLGKMRDFYPIKLFTLDNVLTLLDNACFSDAYYFLAFALLLLVIRVPFFQIQMRIKLLEASYLMFGNVYDDMTQERDEGSSNSDEKDCDTQVAKQKQRNGSNLVTFCEMSTLQKILCTIVSYCAAFQLFSEVLRTDSLGTHIVEQKIGQARQGMDNRWTKILSTISHSVLRSLMLSAEGIQLGSSARLKTCGCCLDSNGNMTIEEFDPLLVSQVMWHSLSEPARTADCFSPSFEKVRSWLKVISKTLEERSAEIGKMWAPSQTTNSGIMSRLINTRKDLDKQESK